MTPRKILKVWYRVTTLALLGLMNSTAYAQGLVTIPNTVRHEIQSAIIDQTYILDIALPYQYKENDERYPVVYLLDANNDFPLVTSIARRLQAEDELKEFFIVGISYPNEHWVHRRRDYTPTHVSHTENSGGGVNFAKILETEITPYIDREFRTIEGSRTLLGHSLGGLFGAYLLVNNNTLFDSYIISSPSLWWNETIVLKGQSNNPRQQRPTLFMTVGAKENPHMIKAWKDLHSFTAQAFKNSAQMAISLDGENHASAKFRAYADGLRWLFAKDVENKRQRTQP